MKHIESFLKNTTPLNETVKNVKQSLWYANRIVTDIKNNGVHITYKIKYEQFAVSPLVEVKITDIEEKDHKIIDRIIQSWKPRLLSKQHVLSSGFKNDILTLYIKDLHVGRENPPQYIYHTTSERNVEDIMTNGLVPKSGEWLPDMEYPPAVFASISDDPQEWFQYDSVKAVFRIDTSNLKNKWWTDLNIPNRSFGYIMTFEMVPISAIELLSKEDIVALRNAGYQDYGMMNFSDM